MMRDAMMRSMGLPKYKCVAFFSLPQTFAAPYHHHNIFASST